MRGVALGLLVSSLLAAAAAAQSSVAGGPSAGRTLWLRADRGVEKTISNLVVEWRDLSGAGNHVTNPYGPDEPEWRAVGVNGKAALHFDGNDWLSAVAGMPTGSYTKVAVLELDDLAPTNNVFSGWYHHALYYGGGDKATLFHSGNFAQSAIPTSVGAPVVIVATYDATTGDGVIWQDGVLAGSGNDGGVGNWDPTVLLGSFGFGFFLQGSIAEVMAYDHVLSAGDLGWLHSYLLARYHGDPAPSIAWRALPQPAQVFQRDASGHALVSIDGDVTTAGYDGITVEVTQDGMQYDSRHQILSYAGGVASFLLQPQIDAGLHDYSFAVFAEQGPRRRLIARIDDVACGDVFLINGQSNAAAGDYWGEGLANALQSRWIRSFGTASIAGDVTYDLHWDRADGQSYLWHGSIGQWAIKLASRLWQDEQLPIAMINGAVGGTSSSQHLRNDADHDDLNTIYGRLLYRAEQAGVAASAPMMLWYQGESDGDNGQQWALNFSKIHDAWLEDYPSLVQVDLFQERDNCAGDGREVRERQRQVPIRLADCYAMSTTGADGHDGCHFKNVGYFELGVRLARAIERDRYGSTLTTDVDAPAIVSATWNDSAHTQILLTFKRKKDTLHFDAGAEANFFTDDGVAVTSGTVVANTVLLQLAGPSVANEINYDGHPLDGPWLANARNVGALTFFHVPVQ